MMRAFSRSPASGADAVAEGSIRSPAVRKLGTQFGQGWRYGRPMPAEAWGDSLRLHAIGAAQ
jgi:sensor c-di-GMP phosphodiesterase-like protein